MADIQLLSNEIKEINVLINILENEENANGIKTTFNDWEKQINTLNEKIREQLGLQDNRKKIDKEIKKIENLILKRKNENEIEYYNKYKELLENIFKKMK